MISAAQATSAVSAPRPLDDVRRRAGRVRKELRVASAELGLAHGALDRHLPADVREGDVAWALDQNAAVERKVEQAAEELREVDALLREEQAERQRLEEALAEQGRS
jgi:hypothetical protein